MTAGHGDLREATQEVSAASISLVPRIIGVEAKWGQGERQVSF